MPSKANIVRVRCYAKINLGLRVIGLRPDRYHELRTVFQTVSLFDDLEATRYRGRSGVSFQCNIAEIAGPENLAVKAAAAMAEELKMKGRIDLRLHKRIPMGAGLGGGSSDAAAAMRAVTLLAGKLPSRERMLQIAASLGADVPFFLLGGTALAFGRGTEVYALPDLPRRWMVLVHPPVHVDTRKAYAALDTLERPDALTESSKTNRIYSFCASTWGCRGRHDFVSLINDFEPVVFETYPLIARLKKHLIRAGASPALLSGSGSAVFGLCKGRREASVIASKLAQRFPDCRVVVLRTVSANQANANR